MIEEVFQHSWLDLIRMKFFLFDLTACIQGDTRKLYQRKAVKISTRYQFLYGQRANSKLLELLHI